MHNSFDREELQAPLAEINMTPLVDVMLVLLVIFLVTAPMLNNAIKLNLPSESAQQISEQKTATIVIDATGQYYFNDQPMNLESLEIKLGELAKNGGGSKNSIHFRADVSVPYGKVSQALASAQRHGLSSIGFITEPK